jgi:6-phosphogluconolactonase
MMAMNPTPEGMRDRSMDVEIQVCEDVEEIARVAASEVLRQARQTVQEKGFFSFVLSGGSTPGPLYSLLAGDPSVSSAVPWNRTHFFWGDERHVPTDHPESNYRMAKEALLSKVPVPGENIHPIRSGNPDAHQAAEEYEDTVRTFFRLKAGEFPRFDLVLLGMGPDGHTASLFPGTEALQERRRLVVANWVEKFHAHRITMTLPLLNQAALVLFLVSGEEKAETLREVIEGKERKAPFPSHLIRPADGRLLWLVDRKAGRLLKSFPRRRGGS